jgi:membrane-associated HD superfamily phosphohydrolase
MIPLTLIPVFLYFRQIRKIEMDQKRERLVPLFLTMICLFIGYYLVAKFSPIRVINIFLLASSVIAFLILIISVFWKISIHMAGIGGITALIAVLSYSYKIDMTIMLCIIILISGIIASARLAMGAHSPLELLAGFAIGLVTVGGFLI